MRLKKEGPRGLHPEPADAVRARPRRAAGHGRPDRARRRRPGGHRRRPGGREGQLLLAPRLSDRYPVYGVVAEIEQVGRLPGGAPAAVLRATGRARIGSGRPAPAPRCGSRPSPSTTPTRPSTTASWPTSTSASSSRSCSAATPGRSIDSVQRVDRPVRAGRHGRLRVLPVRRAEARAAGDPRRRAAAGEGARVGARAPRRARGHREDPRRRARGHGQAPARVPAAPAARRDPQGARRGRARGCRRLPHPRRGRRPAARRSARPRCARSASWSAPATRRPSRAGSAPGSTPCSSCRGTTKTDDNTDIAGAREILDADHHGLDDVKDRIVEYLAVRARRAERGLEVVGGRGSGAVLALVGPPGVGKTSLGESVARALGRKFVRVALGGVRDEAEIRGHRRTYVGALPGRIVRAISEAGSMNPVVLLDEVDKVGSRLPRRPGGGAARGARPGAEPHLPRPLPRGRPRPVRRAVPGDGQRRRHHPGRAAGPDGGRHPRRLHRGRQGRHRPHAPAAAAARAGGARARTR